MASVRESAEFTCRDLIALLLSRGACLIVQVCHACGIGLRNDCHMPHAPHDASALSYILECQSGSAVGALTSPLFSSTAAKSGTETLARCRADPGRTLCDSVRRMALTMLLAIAGPDSGLRTCIRQACHDVVGFAGEHARMLSSS